MPVSSPLVSIIVPTYNHAPMLKEALRSVQAQTLTDWEAVVINNHSTDDTVEVVNSLNDPRIRLFNFRNHGIIAASRNEGIRQARADLIAFLDSDDLWYPEKLELSLAAIASGADLSCHGEIWRQDDRIIARMQYGPLERADYRTLLFEGNCLSTSAVVVRKERLLEADCFSEAPEMVTAEDYELWLKLARNGVSFAFPETMLGEYRIHGGNASKAVLRNMLAELAVVEKHAADMEHSGIVVKTDLQRRKAIIRISAARRLLTDGGFADAARCLTRAFLDYPLMPLTIMGKILKKLKKG